MALELEVKKIEDKFRIVNKITGVIALHTNTNNPMDAGKNGDDEEKLKRQAGHIMKSVNAKKKPEKKKGL